MGIAGNYHQVDGNRVYCQELGQGDPLVLIHGFLVSHKCWEMVIEQLGEHFTVYAIDLPGFGESDRPSYFPYDVGAFVNTVAGLMDSVGISHARIMGHSLGGAVSLALAAAFPERVERLVAVGAAAYPFSFPLEGRLALIPVLGDFLFKKLYAKRDMRRYFRREVYLSPGLPSEETLNFYWERFNRPGGRAAAHMTLRGMSDLGQLSGLPGQIRCPVLVAWGAQDRIFPLSFGERLARELEDGRLVTITGSGHAPMEEAPTRFLEEVIPFLEQ